MRDLHIEELGHVYGAGGKSCYNPCGGGKGGSGSKGKKGSGSKHKKGSGSKGKKGSGSKGRCY